MRPAGRIAIVSRGMASSVTRRRMPSNGWYIDTARSPTLGGISFDVKAPGRVTKHSFASPSKSQTTRPLASKMNDRRTTRPGSRTRFGPEIWLVERPSKPM